MNRFKNLVVALLATLLLTALPQTAWAAEPTTTWDEATGTLTFVADGTSDEVILPTGYNTADIKEVIIESGYTSIGYRAFRGCSNLSSMTIPDGVTSIRSQAFFSCTSLSSVDIPASVTSIGDSAFYGCSSLSSVTIPEGVTGIGDSTFADCSSLSSVTIPESVTSIGSTAFFGCSLSSVTIPNGVTSIGHSAFYGCSSLSSVTISDSVTSIGKETFRGCSSLSSVTISNSVTSIEDYTFYGCSSLGSVTIPDSVTSIGGSAFNGCSNLSSVTIPDSVTSIGGSAFNGCSSLSSVTISNSVTSIEDSIFYGCSSLSSVTIPDSATSIGKSAFNSCSSLSSVTIPDSVTSIGDYAFYRCSNLGSVAIPNSVTSIGYSAFRDCSGLSSVTLPDSMTSIGEYAFQNCSSLSSSVTIPKGIKRIESDVFNNCSSLSSVTIPDSVTSIGGGAFSNCSSLSNVVIPASVTSIGDYAFYGCSSLSSVTMSDGTLYIGQDAFNGCSSLSSVTIPSSVTSIGSNAFNGCSSLSSATILGNIVSISYGMFRNCSSLSTVTIPASVKSIENWAFMGGCKVTDVYYSGTQAQWNQISIDQFNLLDDSTIYCSDGTINPKEDPPATDNKCGENLTWTLVDGVLTISGTGDMWDWESTISAPWYENVNAINTVSMGSGVTSIGDGAFSACGNLTSMTIPNSVTRIGDIAFYCCSNLTSITIPSSVTSIGELAFYGCSRLADVYYGGTRAQWNQITIGPNNEPLLNAAIHCQDDGEEPVSYTVTQSIGTPDNSNPPRYIVTGERDEVLICNGPLTEFQALYLDGRALARGTDYTVQGSSVTPGVDDEVQGGLVPVQSRAGTEPETVITIAKACFQPQDNNVHTIAAEFRTADGTVQRASQNFYYPTQPDPEMVTLPAGVKYVPYSWRPEQTEGTYSVVAGTLPNGLRVNGETGEVTGVPMVSGSWNFTVRHQGADTAYSLTIEDNTNTAVQQPNDYPITTPVGTPSPSDPNQFILYEYTDRVLIIDGPYDEFMHLRIDGQLLTRDEDYSARSGSTVITIFGQTFEKFGEGTHTLSAEFRENKDPNGKLKTVSQNYTVNLTRPNQPSQPGNTGSSGNSGSSGSSSSNKRPSANLPKPVTPGTSGTSSTSSTPSSTTPSTTTPSTPSTTPSTPSTPAEQTPVATGLPFGDVSADSWYFEDVKWAYEGEIMTGETETSFGPQHQISQATIVTVLARLGKIDLTQYDGAADSSIAAGKWYTNAALWAKQSGILPDYSEFTGEETITRDQMAIMLVKYLRSMGNNTTPPVQPAAFADADLMSQDGNDAFQVLYAYNIFRGVGSGKMDPAGATTRAQFAALVHRVAEAA